MHDNPRPANGKLDHFATAAAEGTSFARISQQKEVRHGPRLDQAHPHRVQNFLKSVDYPADKQDFVKTPRKTLRPAK